MIAIGIDPGATGALVMIDDQKNILAVHDCPDSLNGYMKVSADVQRKWGLDEVGIFIEEQRYMAKGGRAQGAKSAFSLGTNYGIWQGLFAWRHSMEVRVVPVGHWQRYHYGSGTVIGDSKERSVRLASRMFPTLNLIPDGCKAPRHGRSDAALIAAYGLAWMRKHEND